MIEKNKTLNKGGNENKVGENWLGRTNKGKNENEDEEDCKWRWKKLMRESVWMKMEGEKWGQTIMQSMIEDIRDWRRIQQQNEGSGWTLHMLHL